ncbi:carbohydrate porin [Acidipila rosea]|uniref:OprB family porin n=1 Tax=Acidipila rosea TaxID=768535 RepID=A0A4R1LB93_9BACT|nr:carbohydrate porin [Acidipila rosea]TCK75748.1 OprB family porin [Acidipila rosea]
MDLPIRKASGIVVRALIVAALSSVTQAFASGFAPAASSLPDAPSPQAAIIAAHLSAQQPPASAQSHGPASRQHYTPSPRAYLAGDWGGARTRLAQRGILFDLYYVADSLGNPAGGYDQVMSTWGRFRATVDVDFGKLRNWNGLTFHATAVNQYGVDLGTQYLHSIDNPSGLVSEHTTRLDSLWFDHSLLRHRLFLRIGQFAGMDFYGVQEYGASYLSLPQDYAFGNLNLDTYESFDPAATPAFELRALPVRHWYVKAMVESQDHHPYRDNPTGFTPKFAGPMLNSEVGYIHDAPAPPESTKTLGPEPWVKKSGLYPATYKFGSSYNPHNFTDPLTHITTPGNYVLYLMANQAIYRVGANGVDATRGLDLHFSYDWAAGDVNKVNTQLTTGARFLGPTYKRSKDVLALGYTRSTIGSHFSRASIASGRGPLTAEHVVELSYLGQITPWLILQPDLQYYARLGASPQRGSSGLVIGFRTKVTF